MQEAAAEIRKLNEEEQIYKQLWLARKESHEKVMEVLSGMKTEKLMEMRMIIPELAELHEGYDVEMFLERDSLILSRHNRYTPPFEHDHSFYEMIYVTQGTCINHIHGENQVLNSGDFCIIPPGSRHSLWVDESGDVINILISAKLFQDTFFSVVRQNPFLSNMYAQALKKESLNNYILFHTANDSILQSVMNEMMYQFSSRQDYYEASLLGLLLYFFTHILRTYSASAEMYLDDGRLSEQAVEIMRYISYHYTDITLQEAADHFGYSVSHFSKMISRIAGRSFKDLIAEYKMARACSLLEKSTLNISEIAHEAGYPSVEHFNRMFKRQFDTTPSAWRQEHQQALITKKIK